MRTEISPVGTYVVLLRGINVGGNNKLPMRELAAMLTELGGMTVQTYIQSGNAVLRARSELAATLPEALAARIAERAGITVPVVVFSAEELETVAQSNPFLGTDADTEALHVMFLGRVPSVMAAAGLDPRRSVGDDFTVVNRQVYLRCPKGFARSKLTNAWFDAKLGTISTCRNWRTVQTLLELTRPLSAQGPLR